MTFCILADVPVGDRFQFCSCQCVFRRTSEMVCVLIQACEEHPGTLGLTEYCGHSMLLPVNCDPFVAMLEQLA